MLLITDTTGAQPSPPVTTTSSRPSASCMGQPRPYGPRRPRRSPCLSFCMPRVTRPTARIVCAEMRISDSLRLLHGPAAAIWPTQTEAIALLELLHAARDATDRAYRV